MSAVADADDGNFSCHQFGFRLGIIPIHRFATESHSHHSTDLQGYQVSWFPWAKCGLQQGEALLRAGWQTIEPLGEVATHIGKPQAKNSSGLGANWYRCTAGESTAAGLTVYIRTMFEGTVTGMQACFWRGQAPLIPEMYSSSEKLRFELAGQPLSPWANWQYEPGRIGIFGTGNAYAGSSGRVTSERIGRDLNPLGRGDGYAYVGGDMRYGQIAPRLPASRAMPGNGNSVNNHTNPGPVNTMTCVGGYGDFGCEMCYPVVCEQVITDSGIDYPCLHTCEWTEWMMDPEGCRYRECTCLGSGCVGTACIIPDNCYWFYKNGCGEYGTCTKDASIPHPVPECVEGEYNMGGGLGAGGGFSGGDGCPGCGGGGNGGGGGIAQQAPPGGPAGFTDPDCMNTFIHAWNHLKAAWPITCCCTSPNCDVCKKADLYVINALKPKEAPGSAYVQSCANFGNRNAECCWAQLWTEDGDDFYYRKRVIQTTCMAGSSRGTMSNMICCKHFPGNFTACGGLELGTSNKLCAALIYLLIEAFTCGNGLTVGDCCQEVIDVGLCICDELGSEFTS